MTQAVASAGEINKSLNKNLVQIFVRNYQKRAIRLWLEKKLIMENFRQIISKKMRIKTQDQALFLQGKLIQNHQTELELHNGYIFHLVNLSRVNIPTISIFIKRIQPNSNVDKFIIEPQMLIGEFLNEVLSTKYSQIKDYFLVYTGRQLSNDKNFIQQYIQDGSQILLIHKIQNRKSQNIQRKKKKTQKVDKKAPQQNQKSKQSKKTVNLNINQSFNPKLFNGNTIVNKQLKKTDSWTQNNQKYQLVNNSFRYQTPGLQDINKQNQKNQQYLQKKNQSQNYMFQTAKFSKIEDENMNIKQQAPQEQKINSQVKSSFFKKEDIKQNVSQQITSQKQQTSSNQQTEQILIGNYNAFSYNNNKNNLNQKAISPIKNPNLQTPEKQIITRYGFVPQNQLTRIDRQVQEEQASNIVLGESVQLLNQRSSLQLKPKSQQEQKNAQQQFKNTQKQNQPFSDPYLKVSNGSYQKINSLLLKTISSRYDDQGMSLQNSQLKRQLQNELSYAQSQPYSGGIKSSLKYRIGYHNMEKVHEISAHRSFKDTANRDLQNKNENENENENELQLQNQNIQENTQKNSELTVKSSSNLLQIKKSSQKFDQSFQMGGGDKKNHEKFKKQNMIDVKDMTQTVDPAFYMPPNLQASDIIISKPKLSHKSQVKSNFKNPKEAPRNHTQEQQISCEGFEQDQNLQNISFVNIPIRKQQGKNQILQGVSKTYSVEQPEEVKKEKEQKLRKNSQLEQNSSAVSAYLPQFQAQDNPYNQMIQLANKRVKFQLSPQQKQQLYTQNKIKQPNLYNMSQVSSKYQRSLSDHSEQNHQFSFNPNNVYLPNLNNFMGRDSFVSDAPNSIYSQKFSVGSVQSYVISSTEYPNINPPPLNLFQNKERLNNQIANEGQEEKMIINQKKQQISKQQSSCGMSLSMKKKKKVQQINQINKIQSELNHQSSSINKNSSSVEVYKYTQEPDKQVIVQDNRVYQNKMNNQQKAQDSLLLQDSKSSKNIQSSQNLLQEKRHLNSQINMYDVGHTDNLQTDWLSNRQQKQNKQQISIQVQQNSQKVTKDDDLLNYLFNNSDNKIKQVINPLQDYVNQNNLQTYGNKNTKNQSDNKKFSQAHASFSFSYQKQYINPQQNIYLNIGDMIMAGVDDIERKQTYAQAIRQQIFRQFELPLEYSQEFKERQLNKMRKKERQEAHVGRNNIDGYLKQFNGKRQNRQTIQPQKCNSSSLQKQQSNLMQDQMLYQYQIQQKQKSKQQYQQDLLNDYI